MNANQRRFLDAALSAVRQGRPGQFFLDAPAGTGKTFCLNTLLAGVRGDGKIAIAVATSGIAAILLSGGRTFHSRFKAPLKLREGAAFGVRREDGLAVLLRRASLIVWDEAAMGNRNLLEGLDATLRFLRDDEATPFGGVTVVVSGISPEPSRRIRWQSSGGGRRHLKRSVSGRCSGRSGSAKTCVFDATVRETKLWASPGGSSR